MNSDYLVTEDVDELLSILSNRNISISEAQLCTAIDYLREKKVTPKHLKDCTGIQEPQLRHKRRVSKLLDTNVFHMLHRGKITFSLARAIASLPTNEQEIAALKAISARTSVANFRRHSSGNKEQLDEETERYYKQLADLIAMQTGIDLTIKPDKDNKHNGTIQVRYVGNDGFEAVCDRLSVDLSEF